jgi:hypothetical protein
MRADASKRRKPIARMRAPTRLSWPRRERTQRRFTAREINPGVVRAVAWIAHISFSIICFSYESYLRWREPTFTPHLCVASRRLSNSHDRIRSARVRADAYVKSIT